MTYWSKNLSKSQAEQRQSKPPKHITVKLLKTEDKKDIFKAIRGKRRRTEANNHKKPWRPEDRGMTAFKVPKGKKGSIQNSVSTQKSLQKHG